MESAWDTLTDELDGWHHAGRAATLWWRDDDAVAFTPALERLLDVARRHAVEIAVAVIPARLEASLGERLREAGGHAVQHGWAHVSHAPAGEKSAELGAHRDTGAVLDELAQGWRAMCASLDPLPAMVPPWNRIADPLVARLGGAGYAALSRYSARVRPEHRDGLREVNCHLDVIDWKGSRGFKGTQAALSELCAHLAARRSGTADVAEPSGLLTHHLVHDEGVWSFVERLLEVTRAHPAVRWLSPPEALLG